ncbi:MAG: phosphoglucosamine mutase, partial [Clostridia bacterium]|nr:phosphoglucosamine mutase [Clostridia bacterium]
MSIKFGTDGIRGIAYEEITIELAYKLGNALGRLVDGCRIIVGRDTRVSGEDLSAALAEGLADAGGDVLDCKLMPTAGVAYLVKRHNCDFGVVISASHNPPEYNGIKVFDAQGFKASEEVEEKIQILLDGETVKNSGGQIQVYEEGQAEYEDFLVSKGVDLSGMRILLDCSNGACARIAPSVFKRLGADVTALNTLEDGNLINENCGAVNAHLLSEMAKDFDVTFAFDGDSDRLIALDEKGEIVDGDKNLVIIGRYLKERGELAANVVVGTSMTNLGIEKAIREIGVDFQRVDVGDKYVLRRLLELGGALGGEGSGHTIILSESSTGDGVQTAVALSKIIKSSGKTLSYLADIQTFPQIISSLSVKDKNAVLGDKSLLAVLNDVKSELKDEGRVILRASGTEQKIRGMVESKD